MVSLCRFRTLTLVLYSRRDGQWKLTDFGISAEATSKKAITTRYSQGTSSYRAPELLDDEPTFTNKVDIWALGCILYELAKGRVAFREDWARASVLFRYLELVNYFASFVYPLFTASSRREHTPSSRKDLERTAPRIQGSADILIILSVLEFCERTIPGLRTIISIV